MKKCASRGVRGRKTEGFLGRGSRLRRRMVRLWQVLEEASRQVPFSAMFQLAECKMVYIVMFRRLADYASQM